MYVCGARKWAGYFRTIVILVYDVSLFLTNATDVVAVPYIDFLMCCADGDEVSLKCDGTAVFGC